MEYVESSLFQAPCGFGGGIWRIITKSILIVAISEQYRALVEKIKKKVSLLISLIQYIQEGNKIWKYGFNDHDRREVYKTISFSINLYERQKVHRHLSKRQQTMMGFFNEIQTGLKQTELSIEGTSNKISFWSFLEGSSEVDDGKCSWNNHNFEKVPMLSLRRRLIVFLCLKNVKS